MFNESNDSKSSNGSRGFRIISRSGNEIYTYRPDKLGASVVVDKDTVMTVYSSGKLKEVYRLQPGERIIFDS
jgi:hypothetical protein